MKTLDLNKKYEMHDLLLNETKYMTGKQIRDLCIEKIEDDMQVNESNYINSGDRENYEDTLEELNVRKDECRKMNLWWIELVLETDGIWALKAQQ